MTALPGLEVSKPASTSAEHPHPGQWRLKHVQLSNWGTFDGTHNVPISEKGYFLTGGPGTGKSTLLDAISALLTPPRSLHFNAAASDAGPVRAKYRRTVASYVRGAYAMNHDPATGEFIQEILRDKTTLSVISLRYVDGTGRTCQLSRIMLLAKGHSTDSDVKNLYVISDKAIDASEFRPFVGTQIEGKALEKAMPGTETFRQFREYRAKFCQILGIPDEKALSLLHKIQSAKELGDINALLRDYMLDEPRTFDLADQALANFASLSEVYEALVTARKQRDLLRTVKANAEELEKLQIKGGDLVDRRHDIEVFAAQHLVQLLKDELERLTAETDRLTAGQHRLTQDIADSRHDLTQLKQQRRSAGGGEIDDWKHQAAGLEVERDRRRERGLEFNAQIATLGLRTPISEDMFLSVQRDVQALKAEVSKAENESAQAIFEAETKVRDLAKELAGVKEELASLTARASNLHREDILVRDLLANQLEISPEDLPYAAELLQVKAGEEAWTAAAEQALRPLAHSILVPEKHYRAFAAALNKTKLRRRVVYNRIRVEAQLPKRLPVGGTLAEKIEIKPGPFENWLAHEIASRMDYVCAETLEEFTRENRAVLVSGQIKHSATRHEKNADRFINDRSNWVLGFDNRAKRTVFEQERSRTEKALFEAQAARKDLEGESVKRREKLFAIQKLESVTWDDIDAATVARRIANLNDMIRSAEEGSSALTDIAARIREVEQAIAEGEDELQSLILQRGRVDEQLQRAQERLEQAEVTAASHNLDEKVLADMRERFAAIAPTLLLSNIDQATKDASTTLDVEIMNTQKQTSRAEEEIRSGLREFVRLWPTVAGDTEPSVAAVGEFMAILKQIEHEKLPEVEDRFFNFFTGNTLSDVQALATAIAQEPALIRQRLSRINALLGQVEFHGGRFLQLSMRPVKLAALDHFKQALKEATEGVVENDLSRDREKAEARFQALKHLMGLINQARTNDDQTSRVILDVRRHVHFHAEEVDASGKVVHAHSSGGPLSGGQNERLATFCLAAALRYQLAGTGAEVPRYAPIIIDEAFSKGAGKFITAAMESFRHFGFQVMLANPGKNPQALAPFIGGVGVVSIRDDKYSSVSPIEFVSVE